MNSIDRGLDINAGNTVDVPINLLESDDEESHSDDEQLFSDDDEGTVKDEMNKGVSMSENQSKKIHTLTKEKEHMKPNDDNKKETKHIGGTSANETADFPPSKIPKKKLCRLASRRTELRPNTSRIALSKSSRQKFGRSRRALLGFTNEASRGRSPGKTELTEEQKKELLEKLRKERGKQKNALRKVCEKKDSNKSNKVESSLKHPVIILDSDVEDDNYFAADGNEIIAWSEVSSMSNDSNPPTAVINNIHKRGPIAMTNAPLSTSKFSRHSEMESNQKEIIETNNRRDFNNSNSFSNSSKNNKETFDLCKMNENTSSGWKHLNQPLSEMGSRFKPSDPTSSGWDRFKQPVLSAWGNVASSSLQTNISKTRSDANEFPGTYVTKNEKKVSCDNSHDDLNLSNIGDQNNPKNKSPSGWGKNEKKKRVPSGWERLKRVDGCSSGWVNKKSHSSVQSNHGKSFRQWKKQDKSDDKPKCAPNDDNGTQSANASKNLESFSTNTTLEQSKFVDSTPDKTRNRKSDSSRRRDSKTPSAKKRKCHDLIMTSTPIRVDSCVANSSRERVDNKNAPERTNVKNNCCYQNAAAINAHQTHVLSSNERQCGQSFPTEIELDSNSNGEKHTSDCYNVNKSTPSSCRDTNHPSSGARSQNESKTPNPVGWEHFKETVSFGWGATTTRYPSSQWTSNNNSLLGRRDEDDQKKTSPSGWGRNKNENGCSSGCEIQRRVDKSLSSWTSKKIVSLESSDVKTVFEKNRLCSNISEDIQNNSTWKAQNLSVQSQSAKDNSLLEIVETNGMVMVAGDDNKNRRFLFPWPARIVSAEESDDWRQKCKKNHVNIAPDKVCVIYFFPCWISSLDFHVNVVENWWHVDFVDESNIFPFEEVELGTYRLPESVLSRFQRGLTVAKGLKNWAIGAGFKKRKAQYKCKVEGTHHIHHCVVEYCAILKIRDNEWLEKSKSMDPTKIIEMINFELPGYNSEYLKNSKKLAQNSVNTIENTIALPQNRNHELFSEKIISSNDESQDETRRNSCMHDLFTVVDKTRTTPMINRGKINSEDSTSTNPNSPAMHYSLYRALGTQNKAITKCKESSDIYHDLEAIPHIPGSSDVNSDSVLNILSKLCKRINQLEDEKEKIRKNINALQRV